MTILFQPVAVFSNTAANASRMAVLYGLYPPAKTRGEIIAQTMSLTGLWPQRLQQLAGYGWQPRSPFAPNCWPAFCLCRPRTGLCGLDAICPHCFARNVGHIYARFRQTVSQLSDRENWKLITRVKSVREPLVDSADWQKLAENAKRPKKQEVLAPLGASADWLTAAERKLTVHLHDTVRRRRRLISAIAPYAAYAMTTVEPGADCWHFRHRQLLLVQRDFRMPAEAKCSPWADPVRISEIADLSPRNVARAVAKTFGYPVLMLRGPADLAAVCLRARRRVRLSAAFGSLRRSAVSEAPPWSASTA